MGVVDGSCVGDAEGASVAAMAAATKLRTKSILLIIDRLFDDNCIFLFVVMYFFLFRFSDSFFSSFPSESKVGPRTRPANKAAIVQ